MMDEKKLGWLIEYLKVLSLLKSTRVNEQTRVIEAIENELEIRQSTDRNGIGNLSINIDQIDKDSVRKLAQRINEEIKLQGRYK